MQQSRLRAVFMRGGTSKAVMFHREDLPADQASWAPIFRAVMGSPDPYARQLDGMGGGVSSVSKICIVGPSTHPDAVVDYTFAQVSVKDDRVDFSAICGNMTSAIGPFAIDEGLVPCPPDGHSAIDHGLRWEVYATDDLCNAALTAAGVEQISQSFVVNFEV